MPDTAQWVAILIAAITAGFAKDVFAKLFGFITGRRGARRSELERAWARGDEEARRRRLAEEHSSILRRLLNEAPCVDAATIPPFPTYSERSST